LCLTRAAVIFPSYLPRQLLDFVLDAGWSYDLLMIFFSSCQLSNPAFRKLYYLSL
jgi:hypothetical protein